MEDMLTLINQELLYRPTYKQTMEHMLINVPVLTNAIKVEKRHREESPPKTSLVNKVREEYFDPFPLDCEGTLMERNNKHAEVYIDTHYVDWMFLNMNREYDSLLSQL